MKLSYKTSNIQQFTLIIIANLVLVSCGTYQSVYNDGIYNSDTNSQREKKVIIAGEKEYENYNNTYFTNELERLDNLNDEAVFTDVDTYSSPDSTYVEDGLNYNTNPSWGNNDNNDVVVHVNSINGSNWNDFGFGYNNFGWNNGGFNNWGPRGRWGWNNGFNNWGYNRFWNPYYNNFAFGQGFNNGFYNPYYGAFSNPYRFNNNSYYSNTRIGRRGTYNNTFRRGVVNARNSSITSRRRTSIIKPTSFSTRRRSIVNTTPTRRSSSSTRRSSSNTSRNSNSTRRSISNRRNSLTRANSSTRRRGSSNSTGNSSSTRRNNASRSSSNTSRRTSTPSRSSSSIRSSSSRSSGSSKGSSSSIRSSSSRSSGSSKGSSSSGRRNN
jgi:hypothetical protein